MKLVIGGAYQGKLAYAQGTYDRKDGWIDGTVCGDEEIWTCGGIFHFHEYVRRFLSAPVQEENPLMELQFRAESFARELLWRNPDLVIVTNELGCGVVPLDEQDRLWRELTGRVCTCLAARAEEVVRVMCGIGLRIK